jgi:hypothetical protein
MFNDLPTVLAELSRPLNHLRMTFVGAISTILSLLSSSSLESKELVMHWRGICTFSIIIEKNVKAFLENGN